MSEEKKELTDEEKRAKAREVNENLNKSRLERVEQIADSSEEARGDDLEDESERTERLAREADEAAAKRLQAEGATEEEVKKDIESDTKEVNGETYYRQIVNGQEKWQTLKEIRSTAQKVETADEYLRQASESVRNASRLALSEKDVPSRPDKDGLKKLLASAALGDEEAIEQLASVLSATPSAVTPDVLRAVDQRLSFRTELATLESEQKELLEDPYLAKLFRTQLDELKQKDPNTPLASAYRTIGKDLREHFGGMLKGTTQEKLERKRKLAQVPSASQRQVVETGEEGEEDPSTVIAEMAKKRGFVPHLHLKGQS
jgi:hypothetical protein